MNKILLKSLVPLLMLTILMIGNVAVASEITGNLSTGISATVGATFNGTVISPPIASPTAGSYTSAQSVTLVADGATSIRYTTDGTAPTCSSGTLYSSAVAVASSLALEAISCYPNNKASTVASYLYAINVPAAVVNNTPNTGGPSTGSGQVGGGGSGGGNNNIASTAGDINKDGRVDIGDFVTVMANWGQTSANNSADLNSDSNVDILDFVILMANWTK